jgi:Zn-dependent metalloprotease
MQRRTSILSILASALVALPSHAAVPEQAQARRVAEVSAEILAAKIPTLGLNDQHAFAMKNHIGDELGQVHTRFQQSYNGVKVWGGEAIMHIDTDGRELPMTDVLMRNLHLNTNPSMEPREALAVAHAAIAPKGAYTEEPSAELVIYPQSANVLAAHARSKNEADIDAMDLERQVTRYTLAYHVHATLLNGAEETRSQDYLINAHTGEILKSWDTLHTAAANGTGKSQWYGTVALNTNSVTSGFELRDTTRGTGGTFGNNVTTNLNHGTSGTGSIYTDADNAWGDGNGYGSGTTTSTTGATGQTAAVDQHHGMAATWDFYKNVLGRNGIDNTGKAAYGIMHYSSNYDNAFWQDSCFCMTYGDGAPPSGSYGEADLDTVGHEMTHGVCATTANLTYSGESGGLNESNSDIFGTCVEFYVLGAGGTGSVVPDNAGTGTITANYMMFENSWGHAGQALRYMYKPSLDGASPDAWSSTIGSKDVHYSSGPMNRCFFFMARGATTTGDTSTTYLPSGMTGIGNDKAARIWYRTLTTKLTASSNYAAARTGAIAAAQELYGAGSAAEQAVWNAFHGINVGAAWTSSTPTAPAITTQPASTSVAVGTAATFSVTATGSATLAYQWRKNGTNITSATAASYTTPAATTADNASTFSVVVSNSVGSVTSNNATLTVTSTPPPPPGNAEVEPNNTQATAQNIATSGTTINATIANSTDIDYFKCTVGAGRTVAATMTPNATSDYDLYLYNSNGTLLTSSTKGTGLVDAVSNTNTGTSAFTRFVKVIYYSGKTGSTGTYTLKMTF